MASLDISTRYANDAGEPLLRASEIGAAFEIDRRTVYKWKKLGYLELAGLDDDGVQLYNAAEAARVKGTPRHRVVVSPDPVSPGRTGQRRVTAAASPRIPLGSVPARA